MDDRRDNRVVITILFLCLLWYAVSSSSNVVDKMLLSKFPYPLTVTMVQLTSITVYSGLFFNLWGVRKYSSNITWSYYLRLIIPLALGKFLATVFSHVSIWKVPVSYAHTGMHTKYILLIVMGFRAWPHKHFSLSFTHTQRLRSAKKTNQLALSDSLKRLVTTLRFNKELKSKTNHIKITKR